MTIRFYTTADNANALTKAANKNGFYFKCLTRTDAGTLVYCATTSKGQQYIKDNGIEIELDNKIEPVVNYRYKLQDREAGNMIGLFPDYESAKEALDMYEDTDKEDGTYTEDFYEIKELETDERTRYRIGSMIKGMRFAQGITQKQLADAAGTNQPHIAKIEDGTLSPTLDTLARIAEALGRKIDFVD